MAVYDPPTVAVGSPVLAAGLDGLLRAADERLERLFSGSRSWWAFNTSAAPAHQIPPTGAVYVLSDDADRDLLPAPGTAGCPHGGNWPAQYDHAAHVAEAAALTITGADTLDIAWVVTGSFSPDVYTWGDSASVLERTHSGQSRPLKWDGSFEPERFHRYAMADVFIESGAETDWEWLHDKFGCVRFHNLSLFEITIDLGGGQSIAIDSRRVRIVRRLSRTGTWDTTLRRYFPKCLPGDVPMWDNDTSDMVNLPLRSQAANPLFRQCLLQSMFRPHALTDDPGMFSAEISAVLPPVDTEASLAAAVVQQGEFEAIRTSTGDDTIVDRFTLIYSGESLATTPAEWADAGLTVSLDDSTRGAVLEVDGAFTPPPTGVWHFDLISRSTNLTGGIVVAVKSATVTERILLPWWQDATEADAWYSALFLWPSYEVSRSATVTYWAEGTWTPAGGGADTDYIGSWAIDGSGTEVREWMVEWDGSSYGTVSSWNVFTKVIGDALPDGAQLIRQPLLTAVMSTQSVEFWAEQEDLTWDDANSVRARVWGQRGIYVGGQPWGLGTVDSEEMLEPRWQYALWPTIGHDPQTTWTAFPFYGSEEIVWTPLVPSGSGTGNLYHWRLTSPEGAAAGAGWGWAYADDGFTPSGLEPSGTVSSGMTFWRMLSGEVAQAGSAGTYPGKVNTGPQPWPVRDHGWLADRILAGDAVAAGDPWAVARTELWDAVDIGGGSSYRPDELAVGFQIRMTASSFNQLSALIGAMSHVRPLGWEEYVDGFDFDDLVGVYGWDIGISGGGPYIQPYGAVHVFGYDTTVDGKITDLGITPRTMASSQLQALQSIEMREYYVVTTGLGAPFRVDDRTTTRPSIWTSVGNTKSYITADDLHDALEALGFAFNQVRLVQPISIETLVPGTAIETETDTWTDASIGVNPYLTGPFRARLLTTVAVPVPDESDTPELQISAAAEFRVAAERPMRSMIISRITSAGSPNTFSLRRVGDATGPIADSLDRCFGEFDPLDTAAPPISITGGNRARSRLTWWSGRLLGRSGLTVPVLCQPWREVLSFDRGTDETGPKAVTDEEWGSEVGLPDNTARSKWLTLQTGDLVTLGQLGGLTPDYPEKHHVWALLPMDGSLEAM